jgi:FtsH-binding integral membrane protein
VNVYRLVALVLLIPYSVFVIFEIMYLGSPRFWLAWIATTVVLIALLMVAAIAREEETDEEETAREVIRDLSESGDSSNSPGWNSSPETICSTCGGAIPADATSCEHCGATLAGVPEQRAH